MRGLGLMKLIFNELVIIVQNTITQNRNLWSMGYL